MFYAILSGQKNFHPKFFWVKQGATQCYQAFLVSSKSFIIIVIIIIIEQHVVELCTCHRYTVHCVDTHKFRWSSSLIAHLWKKTKMVHTLEWKIMWCLSNKKFQVDHCSCRTAAVAAVKCVHVCMSMPVIEMRKKHLATFFEKEKMELYLCPKQKVIFVPNKKWNNQYQIQLKFGIPTNPEYQQLLVPSTITLTLPTVTAQPSLEWLWHHRIASK